MGLHSGKFCRINGVDTMRQWSINDTARQPKAVASNTLLGTARRKGTRAWSGQYSAYGAQPASGIMPGNIFSFVGYGSPANGVSGAAGLRYEGDAMVNRVAISWNWKGGEIIGHTVDFSGHLDLDIASGADPGDAVAPNLPEVGGTKLEFKMFDVGDFAELTDLTNMTLTLSATVNDYINSSTYVDGALWTGRASGPIDWSLSVSQENDERVSGIFNVGDFVHLRAYTTSALFWLLKYAIVREFTGTKHDRETGAIIARTINFDMNAYYGSTAGSIALPGGTQWWPF